MKTVRSDSKKIDTLNKMADKYFTEKALGPDGKQMRFVMDAVLPHCRKPKALELGYGSGHWTRRLLEGGFYVTVIEGSSVLAERCRRTFGGAVKVVHSLFERFKPEQAYATIIASCVLEHVEKPEVLLGLMRSWLAPKGNLHIVVPNALSLHRRLGVKMKILSDQLEFSKQELGVGHKHIYTAKIFKKQLEQAGLAVDFIKGIFVKPLSSQQMMNWSDELLEAYNKLSDELPEYTAFLYAKCSKK